MRFNAPHIIFRNGHPYFMIRVPTDLIEKFNKKFIRKSLKTQNPVDAKMLAEVYASKAKSSFTLLRAGILTESQEKALVSEYIFSKQKPSTTKAVRLKNLYELYYAEKSPRWSGRTPHEFNKQFENIVKVMGNHPAGEYERSDYVALREQLLERLVVIYKNLL